MDCQQLSSQGTNGHLGVIVGIPSLYTHIVFLYTMKFHLWFTMFTLLELEGAHYQWRQLMVFRCWARATCHICIPYLYTNLWCIQYTTLYSVSCIQRNSICFQTYSVYSTHQIFSVYRAHRDDQDNPSHLRPGRRESVNHQSSPQLGY